MFVVASFGWYFFSVILTVLSSGDEQFCNVQFIFCISYRLGQPCILSMCLSVFFLIIPWALTNTDTVVVLGCHIIIIIIIII